MSSVPEATAVPAAAPLVEPFKLTAAPVPPPLAKEYEYLEVTVIREEASMVFLKVPKGFRPNGRHRRLIAEAAHDIDAGDFEADLDWRRHLRIEGVKQVEESVAKAYSIYEPTDQDMQLIGALSEVWCRQYSDEEWHEGRVIEDGRPPCKEPGREGFFTVELKETRGILRVKHDLLMSHIKLKED